MTTAATFSLNSGHQPLLISMPHNSSSIPNLLANRMHPYAQSSPDTDWLLDSLYDFAIPMGLSLLKPHYSRYVIDLNRPQDDHNLYPGADTTGLCPITCFDRRPIYLPGQDPEELEIRSRITTYWQPYHQALQGEIERMKAEHGYAIVFEAHSIASEVPRFFEGSLPDLNLGTVNGQSCNPALQAAAEGILKSSTYSMVSNGRFQGGYITRAYGQPDQDVHTLQLEISQACYLAEDTGTWLPGKVVRLQPVLHSLLQALLETAQTALAHDHAPA